MKILDKMNKLENLREVAPPIRGELNVNTLLGFDLEKPPIYLQRIPRENPYILRSIDYEYKAIGFTADGGRFRKRSPEEQLRFVQKAASLGLRLLPPILTEDIYPFYSFLQHAQTLDEYIPDADMEDVACVTLQLFEDLRKAHGYEIVYGDRWSHNILVLANPFYGVVNIDPDLEISGPSAKEFEIAQVAYYTLSAGKGRVIPLLSKILSTDPWFDMKKVERYLRGHARHFLTTKFGGIQDETEILIEQIQKNLEIVRVRRKD